LVATWHQEGLATPLVMTPEEFTRSLDAFPLEYQSMMDRHVVIAGAPPFDGIRIDAADVRRACEAQARSHLIHMRQGWLLAAGHHDHLVELVVRSAPPFHTVLSNVARLHSAPHETDAELAAFAEQCIGTPAGIAGAVLSL